jgi:uncharacterized membrane protein
MYFPVMGTMKGAIVPEDKRAAIYNLYRIPSNFIVLFSLLTGLTPTQSFSLNATMLAVAFVLQIILMKRRRLNVQSSPAGDDDELEVARTYSMQYCERREEEEDVTPTAAI